MKKNKISRILLCRHGAIGDVIHTLPLCQYLKSKYPEAKIEYLTEKNISMLLDKYCPFIDKTWVHEKGKEKALAAEILQSGIKVDYLFNLHSSLRYFFFNLFHIRAKRFFQYKKDLRLHAAENFLATYNKSLTSYEKEPVLYVNDFQDLLKRHNLKKNDYVCLVPGVGKHRPLRAWAPKKWGSLVKNIVNSYKELKIVLLGGPDEINLVKLFENINNNQIINLINKLPLVDTAKIISQAGCLISADTGPLHLAAGLGIKVIGLYGPTCPKRFGPISNPDDVIIFQSHTVYTMDSIDAEEVISALDKLVKLNSTTQYQLS